MYEPATVIPGVLLTLFLLTISHVVVWPHRHRVPRLATYAIGCASIGAGIALTCALSGAWSALVVYALHLVPSGVLTALLWRWRVQQALDEEAAKDAAGIEELARRVERTY